MATRKTLKNKKNVVGDNTEDVPADVELPSDDEIMDNVAEVDNNSNSSRYKEAWRSRIPPPGEYKKGENIEMYLVRLENWFRVTKIEESEWPSILIAIVGTYAFSQIMNFKKGDITQSTYNDLKEVLFKRFAVKQTTLYERVKFRELKQSTESISEFVAKIKDAAARCNYPESFIEELLLEKFASSIRNKKIVDELVADEGITWDTAVRKAQIMEDRERKVVSYEVEKIKISNQKCFRCGKSNHTAAECKFAEAKCRKCDKVGHLMVMCKNSDRPQRQFKKDTKNVKIIEINELSKTANPTVKKTININGEMIEFEIDSGAAATVIPWHVARRLKNIEFGSYGTKVRTACGDEYDVFGRVPMRFDGKSLHALIIKNGLRCPLMGRDLLDIAFPTWRGIFDVNNTDIDVSDNDFKAKILKEFGVIFDENISDSIKDVLVDIKLKNNISPAFSKPYELALSKRELVEKELNKLVADGVLESVRFSNWASPIVAVPKKDGGLRICVDFKKTVNPRIEKNNYPLPLIDEIIAKIGHGKIFTVLDLKNAFLQLKVNEKSKELLTINTHKGLFRYNRLPFGIGVAPTLFQEQLDKILAGLENAAWYMDDIIITGQNKKHCFENVKLVCDRLRKFNVKVNFSKSKFFESKVEFLGHEISDNGISPSKTKTQDLINAKIPETITELRSFLGFVNYYRKFVPNMSTLLHPLYELEKKGVNFEWSTNCQKAFEDVIRFITSSNVIAPFDPSKKSVLTTDASSYGIGAVLSQDGKPVIFASRTLNTSERKLPQIHKEALAIVDAVRRFHKYVYGYRFTLVTDHRPLRSIFGENKGLPKHTINRLQHYAIFLQGYDFEIKHRRGVDIKDADFLSRLPIADTRVEYEVSEIEIKGLEIEFKLVNLEEVASETKIDPDLKVVKQSIENGFAHSLVKNYREFYNKRAELHVVNDCIFWNFRIVIPKSLRIKCLTLLHDQHIGSTRMRLLARRELWYPSMDKDIENFVSSCKTCQIFEDRNNKDQDLSNWPRAKFPMERIHVDFYSKFGRDFFIWIDAYSRYIDIKEIENKDSVTVLKLLKQEIALFGFPHTIVSDNGPPFNSYEIEQYCKAKNIEHLFSPPYHPQSNGVAERGVGTAKRGINKIFHDLRENNKLEDCDNEILSFLFKYRNTPCTVTNKTPNEMVFGYAQITDLSMIRTCKFFSPLEYDGQNAAKFKLGEKVRILNPKKGGVNWLIGKVVKILSKVRYLIEINGRTRTVHVGSIKKYRERNVVSSEHDYAHTV